MANAALLPGAAIIGLAVFSSVNWRQIQSNFSLRVEMLPKRVAFAGMRGSAARIVA
jgi:hypothetical protein